MITGTTEETSDGSMGEVQASSGVECSRDALLARVSSFPTLPVIVDKVAELVRLPETTAREIEAVVVTDQTLAARLLRLVNSPFYGFAQKVTTISRAVGLVGFEALRNLAFSTSVMHLFKSSGSATFEPAEFWKHSIGAAIAAKVIARRLGEKQVEEFFVAGLMHDIGKLVHNEFFREAFNRAGELALERGVLLREAEKEVLGFTHDQTAGILLTHWRLPQRLVAMVTDHHEPCRTREYAREGAVIHLADILCRAKGLGSGGDNKMPRLDQRAWEHLCLTVGDIEQVMSQMDKEFEPATSILTE
jgi:putative nucleotidyltransferase with HDIG domain